MKSELTTYKLITNIDGMKANIKHLRLQFGSRLAVGIRTCRGAKEPCNPVHTFQPITCLEDLEQECGFSSIVPSPGACFHVDYDERFPLVLLDRACYLAELGKYWEVKEAKGTDMTIVCLENGREITTPVIALGHKSWTHLDFRGIQSVENRPVISDQKKLDFVYDHLCKSFGEFQSFRDEDALWAKAFAFFPKDETRVVVEDFIQLFPDDTKGELIAFEPGDNFLWEKIEKKVDKKIISGTVTICLFGGDTRLKFKIFELDLEKNQWQHLDVRGFRLLTTWDIVGCDRLANLTH